MPVIDTFRNFRKAMPLSEDQVEEMVADFDALRRGRPLPDRGTKRRRLARSSWTRTS